MYGYVAHIRTHLHSRRRTADRVVILFGGTRGSPGNLEHLECSHQPHIQGRGAQKRTQRAG